MQFSPIGMVVAAALVRDMPDRTRASQIELLGGVMGSSPLGLVLLATMAEQGAATPPQPTDGPGLASVPDISTAPDVPSAEGMIRAHGLVVGSPQRMVSDAPKDSIVGSLPEAGTQVAIGSSVSIVLSAGLIVPTVTTMTEAAAVAALEAAGFGAKVAGTDLPGKVGTVVQQDPAGNSLASSGDTVTISVVRAAKAAAKASSDV